MASLAAAGVLSTAAVSGSTEFAAAGLAGSAIDAYGSYASGQAQQAAAGYNAQVARQNATIATQNANMAGAVGNEQAGIQGLKNKAAVGGILASQGANNVDVNSGSAVDVRAGQQEAGQLSALTIRSNAARQAYGYQVGAASSTGQAAQDVYQGQELAEAGDIGAAGGLLKGIGAAGTMLGGTPQTPKQAYTAQQLSSGSALPTDS
jgi:hypothetical protein